MSLDLPLLFALVLAFAVAMYVVMDGFDLGIGILFPLAPEDADRDAMMNSIAPIWDGNETWLVMGGVLLLGAFPAAYASLLPAFYVPLTAMLFALIFRGVAFEFRFRASKLRHLWDWSFAGGSTLAAFCQGLVLGGFIDGVPVKGKVFAGTTWGFLSPFAVACGFGLVAGYALLGAGWLIFKTEGGTARFARNIAPPSLLATFGFIAFISLWTPLTHEAIAARWFSLPNILFLWPVPFLTAFIAWRIWRSIDGTGEARTFLWSVAIFLLALFGLGISLFPYAVPPSLTIWQAAASTPTLRFIGIGVIIILPITLAYLTYTHWIFRGKSGATYGTH